MKRLFALAFLLAMLMLSYSVVAEPKFVIPSLFSEALQRITGYATATCRISSSRRTRPDGTIQCGQTKSGCLNARDWKYYKVSGSAGKNVTVTLTHSGSGCRLNDLYIYDSAGRRLYSSRSNSQKVSRTVTSSSDITIGIDGDSSNRNCQWKLDVKCEGGTTTTTTTITIPTTIPTPITQPPCSCTSWKDDGCGQGACPPVEMHQMRTCTPSGCKSESRCAISASCPATTTSTTIPPHELYPYEADVDYCRDQYGKKHLTTGEGATATWFVWNGCTKNKYYNVNPGEELVLRVHTDTASCQYPNFYIYEYENGRWVSKKYFNLPDKGGTTEYVTYTPTSNKIRVYSSRCFYLKVLSKNPVEAPCGTSTSGCSNPDGSVSCGQTISGCLNKWDWKYYKFPGSANKDVKVTLTHSGTGCNVNDLYIFNNKCGVLYYSKTNKQTETWSGKSKSDITIGVDGDSGNNKNCKWELKVDCESAVVCGDGTCDSKEYYCPDDCGWFWAHRENITKVTYNGVNYKVGALGTCGPSGAVNLSVYYDTTRDDFSNLNEGSQFKLQNGLTLKINGLPCSADVINIGIATSTKCVDSDGGKNYYVKGTVTQGSAVSPDCCAESKYSPNCASSSSYLAERFCNDGDNLDTKIYTCPNGCIDGACMKAGKTGWARIIIQDSQKRTVDTLIINEGSSKYSSPTGLTIKVTKVAALSDGTIVGVDLEVSAIGTATAKIAVKTGDYYIYSDLGYSGLTTTTSTTGLPI